MHEQSSGGFRCFVSCRQRRKGKKVGKHEKAPLLISAITDYALLTWSLLNPAETFQYIGNAACMAGLALPATPLVLWPQCDPLLPLLWQLGQPVDFRVQGSHVHVPASAGNACVPAEIQYPKWQAQKRQKIGKHSECNAQSSPVSRYKLSGASKGCQGLFQGLQIVYLFKYFA